MTGKEQSSGKTRLENHIASLTFGGLRGVLSYQTDSTIRQPAVVTLENGYLVWIIDYPSLDGAPEEDNEEATKVFIAMFNEAFDRPFSPRPVEGCLEDLLSLAPSATSTDVLAFAQRRGPLGVAPFVSLLEAEHEGCLPGDPGTRVRYMEAVSVYKELALAAKTLVDSVHEMREGLPLEFSDTFQKMFPEKEGNPRQHLYSMIMSMARRWTQAATTKLDVVLQVPNVHPSMTGDSIFRLDFGDWLNGAAWDEQHVQSVGQVKSFFLKLRQRPQAVKQGLQTTWSAFTFTGQRPSVLFNVLAFQLLARVTLPANYYFCGECSTMFQRDYQEGRRRPKHSDIPCCDKCRPTRDKRLDLERKRRAAEAKRLAGAEKTSTASE